MTLEGDPFPFKRPQDAQAAGIETVYQTLAVSPALDIARNMYLGREVRRKGVGAGVPDDGHPKPCARIPRRACRRGIETIQNVGPGQSRPSRVANGSMVAWSLEPRPSGSKVIIPDEPTAALGVRESARAEDGPRPAGSGHVHHPDQPPTCRMFEGGRQDPCAASRAPGGRDLTADAHHVGGGGYHDRRPPGDVKDMLGGLDS